MIQRANRFLTVAAIPAYNEEDSIGKIIIQAANYVDKVVVVDDGSNDFTYEIAKKLGATTIRHEKNLGYGAAIRSCIQAAKKMNAEVAVILDGDGQHDPNDIPKLLEPIEKGEADLVVGTRFVTQQINGISLYRRIGINVLNLLTNLVIGKKVTDTQSGFRAYSRKAMDKIVFFENGMGAGSEVLINARRSKLSVMEVPIFCGKSDDGSTQNPISHGITVVMSILRSLAEEHVHLFFALLGVVFLFFGMLFWTCFSSIFFRSLGFTIIIVGFSTFTSIMLHEISNLAERKMKRGRNSQ